MFARKHTCKWNNNLFRIVCNNKRSVCANELYLNIVSLSSLNSTKNIYKNEDKCKICKLRGQGLNFYAFNARQTVRKKTPTASKTKFYFYLLRTIDQEIFYLFLFTQQLHVWVTVLMINWFLLQRILYTKRKFIIYLFVII